MVACEVGELFIKSCGEARKKKDRNPYIAARYVPHHGVAEAGGNAAHPLSVSPRPTTCPLSFASPEALRGLERMHTLPFKTGGTGISRAGIRDERRHRRFTPLTH